MLRRILEELPVFLLPFLAFLAFLLLMRRNPFEPGHWEARWVRLTIAGLALVIASLIVEGLTAPRHADGYVPPHMENGRLVPGGFR